MPLRQEGDAPIHSVLGFVTAVKTLVNKQARKIQQIKGQDFKEVTNQSRVNIIE